jgi:hypothetical protein
MAGPLVFVCLVFLFLFSFLFLVDVTCSRAVADFSPANALIFVVETNYPVADASSELTSLLLKQTVLLFLFF